MTDSVVGITGEIDIDVINDLVRVRAYPNRTWSDLTPDDALTLADFLRAAAGKAAAHGRTSSERDTPSATSTKRNPRCP